MVVSTQPDWLGRCLLDWVSWTGWVRPGLAAGPRPPSPRYPIDQAASAQHSQSGCAENLYTRMRRSLPGINGIKPRASSSVQ